MAKFVKSALRCGTAALMVYSIPALAQRNEGAPSSGLRTTPQENSTVADSNGSQIEDIVVTATRTETALQNTPIAVSAFSSQTLRERSVTSLQDISNFVPSLSIGSRAGTGSAGGGVSIRGMGVDALDSAAAVGIYIDDVYFASSRGNILGLMDVQRVEVLRGPQGTLFGRNTIAGAIQYVTRKPDQDLGGFIMGTLGNFRRRDAQGALNVPLTDRLAVRVAGIYNDRGGYIRDLLNDIKRGADRTWAARVRASWTPTDRLTVDLKGEYINQKTNGRAVLVDAVNPNAQFVGLGFLFGETRPLDSRYLSTDRKSFPGFNAPDFLRFNARIGQATIAYEASDNLTIKSISALAKYQNTLAQDLDLTPLSNVSSEISGDRTRVFSQELQLNGNMFGGSLDYTVGAYYYRSRQRIDPGQSLQFGFAPPFFPFGALATNIRALAGYGQATYHLTDRLSVTGGLRYSHETNVGFVIGQTDPFSSSFNNLSPYFGVNFQLAPDALLYAKASRGFRAGGITPNAALPGGAFPFGPETAWTYEVGGRFQFADRRITVNPTLFLTNWKQIQFLRLVSTANTVATVTDNAGSARIKGLELETQFAATNRLRLTAAFSYLDTGYTSVDDLFTFEFPFGFVASLPNPVTGEVLPGSTVAVRDIDKNTPLQRAPKFKLALGARYTLPLSDGSKLTGSVDYAYTGSQYAGVTNTASVRMPASNVFNARLQYDLPNSRVSFAVFGTNITNEYYLIGGTDFAKGYTTGARELDRARPREYGVEARFNF